MSGDRLREALELITHIDAGDEQAGWECVRIAREALAADDRGGGEGLHPVVRRYGSDAQSEDFVDALEEHNIYSRGDLNRALAGALAADERGGGEGRWRTGSCAECGEAWPCEATRMMRKDGIPHRLAAAQPASRAAEGEP